MQYLFSFQQYEYAYTCAWPGTHELYRMNNYNYLFISIGEEIVNLITQNYEEILQGN
jgi:hypothetical protein